MPHPANGQISQIDQGSDKGEGLPTLSHDTVSQTLALIDLPNMGTSPGAMVVSPLGDTVVPQNLLEKSKLQLPYPPHAPQLVAKNSWKS